MIIFFSLARYFARILKFMKEKLEYYVETFREESDEDLEAILDGAPNVERASSSETGGNLVRFITSVITNSAICQAISSLSLSTSSFVMIFRTTLDILAFMLGSIRT